MLILLGRLLGLSGVAGPGGGGDTFYLLQGDGVSKITLGDDSGFLLLGEAP